MLHRVKYDLFHKDSPDAWEIDHDTRKATYSGSFAVTTIFADGRRTSDYHIGELEFSLPQPDESQEEAPVEQMVDTSEEEDPEEETISEMIERMIKEKLETFMRNFFLEVLAPL
ncbi:uncharacterized protein LOC130731698 [Lotus japonicus]|uniref:uncharacterized protein LOC130731698 n=1 Tax=Lotus japonicus TaxID=34305 RepID=UPI00258ED244|nr:uncharacterized protein LOC130731698 [Lotus japonicus]